MAKEQPPWHHGRLCGPWHTRGVVQSIRVKQTPKLKTLADAHICRGAGHGDTEGLDWRSDFTALHGEELTHLYAPCPSFQERKMSRWQR